MPPTTHLVDSLAQLPAKAPKDRRQKISAFWDKVRAAPKLSYNERMMAFFMRPDFDRLGIIKLNRTLRLNGSPLPEDGKPLWIEGPALLPKHAGLMGFLVNRNESVAGYTIEVFAQLAKNPELKTELRYNNLRPGVYHDKHRGIFYEQTGISFSFLINDNDGFNIGYNGLKEYAQDYRQLSQGAFNPITHEQIVTNALTDMKSVAMFAQRILVTLIHAAPEGAMKQLYESHRRKPMTAPRSLPITEGTWKALAEIENENGMRRFMKYPTLSELSTRSVSECLIPVITEDADDTSSVVKELKALSQSIGTINHLRYDSSVCYLVKKICENIPDDELFALAKQTKPFFEQMWVEGPMPDVSYQNGYPMMTGAYIHTDATDLRMTRVIKSIYEEKIDEELAAFTLNGDVVKSMKDYMISIADSDSPIVFEPYDIPPEIIKGPNVIENETYQRFLAGLFLVLQARHEILEDANMADEDVLSRIFHKAGKEVSEEDPHVKHPFIHKAPSKRTKRKLDVTDAPKRLTSIKREIILSDDCQAWENKKQQIRDEIDDVLSPENHGILVTKLRAAAKELFGPNVTASCTVVRESRPIFMNGKEYPPRRRHMRFDLCEEEGSEIVKDIVNAAYQLTARKVDKVEIKTNGLDCLILSVHRGFARAPAVSEALAPAPVA